MKVDVRFDEAENKFYAIIEGKECVLKFRPVDVRVIDLYSTFVPPKLRGQQIAGELVEFALQHAKDHNLKVIPSCPYVQWYIDNHPEWSIVVER